MQYWMKRLCMNNEGGEIGALPRIDDLMMT